MTGASTGVDAKFYKTAGSPSGLQSQVTTAQANSRIPKINMKNNYTGGGPSEFESYKDRAGANTQAMRAGYSSQTGVQKIRHGLATQGAPRRPQITKINR